MTMAGPSTSLLNIPNSYHHDESKVKSATRKCLDGWIGVSWCFFCNSFGKLKCNRAMVTSIKSCKNGGKLILDIKTLRTFLDIWSKILVRWKSNYMNFLDMLSLIIMYSYNSISEPISLFCWSGWLAGAGQPSHVGTVHMNTVPSQEQYFSLTQTSQQYFLTN